MTQGSAGKDPLASRQWVERYLAVIGLPWEEPSFGALSRVTRAHLRAVVFENITSLLRRRSFGTPVPPLDREAILANWEAGRGGGVCFEAAYMCQHLLAALGYQATLILTRGDRWDGRHQAVLVQIDGGRFLLDVGNGSPHFDPIPLDRPTDIQHAGLAYRFRPGDTPSEWIQDRWIDNAWETFFIYALQPADEQVRQIAVQHHHLPGESFVASTLTLVRCEDDQVLQLRNHEFTRHTAVGKYKEQVSEPEAYRRLVSEVFRLPALPIVEGVAAWLELARDLPEPWTPRANV